MGYMRICFQTETNLEKKFLCNHTGADPIVTRNYLADIFLRNQCQLQLVTDRVSTGSKAIDVNKEQTSRPSSRNVLKVLFNVSTISSNISCSFACTVSRWRAWTDIALSSSQYVNLTSLELYITYRNNDNRATSTCHRHIKFGEVRPCGFWDMCVDRQSYAQMCSSTYMYFAPLPAAKYLQ